ncbi:hypothetical protein Cfor_04819, partial [Coptotermes formosanus]
MSSLDDGSWRTPTFRQSVVAKMNSALLTLVYSCSKMNDLPLSVAKRSYGHVEHFIGNLQDEHVLSETADILCPQDEAIRASGMPTTKNSMEMENHVFQKAKSKEEYLGFVARLILHVREMNSKKGGGIGVPGSGTGGQAAQDPIGALQNLARQGTGNQIMGLGGPQGGGMVQPSSIPASSLLQTLNQRPQGLPGMQPIQDKMASGIGMGPGPQVGQMVGMPGQMQSGPLSNVACPSQIPSQIRMPLPGQMGGQLQGQIQGQPMGQMPQMPGQITNQMSHMAQMQQSRKSGEGIMMTGQNAAFAGPRNVASNAFLRQSPSPSALQSSPAGLGGAPPSNQMAASPALAPSPSSQLTPMSTAQRSGGKWRMAPSPGSLNTPGPAVPTPSPCNLQEDQAYREKVRQLSKYIEPLRRMINRMGNDGTCTFKLSKMKKLLEILSNPSKRMPLETLLKCEVVLEKLDFKRASGTMAPQASHLIPLKEHHIFSPLLEAVSNTLQSPVMNHTLQRTFGPCLEALFGPEIKMLPPPLKKKKVEETPNDIPDVLQGEIARLDQRFK